MYCPKCAINAEPNQKYCRSCGFSLEQFLQLYEEKSLPSGPQAKAPEQPDETQQRRKIVERWRNIVGGAFLIGMLGIVLGYGATYRAMIVEGNFLIGAIVWLMFIFVATIALLSVSAENLRKRTEQRKLKQSKEAPETQSDAETTSKLQLDAYHEPVLSVTEHTTRSLEPVFPAKIDHGGKS